MRVVLVAIVVVAASCGGAEGGTTLRDVRQASAGAGVGARPLGSDRTVVHTSAAFTELYAPTGDLLVDGVRGRWEPAGVRWSAGVPALAAAIAYLTFREAGGATVVTAEGVVVHADAFDAPFRTLGRLPEGVVPHLTRAHRGRAHGGPLILRARGRPGRLRLDHRSRRLVAEDDVFAPFPVLARPTSSVGVGLAFDGSLWAVRKDGAPPTRIPSAGVSVPLAVAPLTVVLASPSSSPEAASPEEDLTLTVEAETGRVRIQPLSAWDVDEVLGEWRRDRRTSPVLSDDGWLLGVDEDGQLLFRDPLSLGVGKRGALPEALGACTTTTTPGAVLECTAIDERGRRTDRFVALRGERLRVVEEAPLGLLRPPSGSRARDGSGWFWRGFCAPPAGGAAAAGARAAIEGRRLQGPSGGPEGGSGDADPAGEGPVQPFWSSPWCVIVGAPGDASGGPSPKAVELQVPGHVGVPLALVGGRVFGRGTDGTPWVVDPQGEGIIAKAPAPPNADGARYLAQPDGTIVALSRPEEGNEDRGTVAFSLRHGVAGVPGDTPTWEPLPVPPGTMAIGIGPRGSRGLAVAQTGVFRTGDRGVRWVPLSEGLDAWRPDEVSIAWVTCTEHGCAVDSRGTIDRVVLLGWGDTVVSGPGVWRPPATATPLALDADLPAPAPTQIPGDVGFRCEATDETESAAEAPSAPPAGRLSRERADGVKAVFLVDEASSTPLAASPPDDPPTPMSTVRVRWAGRDSAGAYEAVSAPFRARVPVSAWGSDTVLEVLGFHRTGLVFETGGMAEEDSPVPGGRTLWWVAPGSRPKRLLDTDGADAISLGEGVDRLAVGLRWVAEPTRWDEVLFVGSDGQLEAERWPIVDLDATNVTVLFPRHPGGGAAAPGVPTRVLVWHHGRAWFYPLREGDGPPRLTRVPALDQNVTSLPPACGPTVGDSGTIDTRRWSSSTVADNLARTAGENVIAAGAHALFGDDWAMPPPLALFERGVFDLEFSPAGDVCLRHAWVLRAPGGENRLEAATRFEARAEDRALVSPGIVCTPS